MQYRGAGFRPLCSLSLGLLLTLALWGCAPVPEQEPAEQPADETSAAPEAATPSDSDREKEPAVPQRAAQDVEQLLEDAEEALAADRLTTPLHDNAFDRFQAVLLLEPDNEQARSGLQQIFSRYLSLARGALNRGEPGAARALIERARLVDRDNSKLEELEERLAALRARSEPETGDGEDWALDPQQLDQRDPALVEKLEEFAETVRNSDSTLLIVARSDAEGRWIYQQMSEAVPDYRLRGDIRLGRDPRILLLPPIE